MGFLLAAWRGPVQTPRGPRHEPPDAALQAPLRAGALQPRWLGKPGGWGTQRAPALPTPIPWPWAQPAAHPRSLPWLRVGAAVGPATWVQWELWGLRRSRVRRSWPCGRCDSGSCSPAGGSGLLLHRGPLPVQPPCGFAVSIVASGPVPAPWCGWALPNVFRVQPWSGVRSLRSSPAR